MKYLATVLLILGFGLSAFGQTIKSLGYNTTNGQVVVNTGTNVLNFTNIVAFGGIAGSDGVLVWNPTDNEFYAAATFNGEISFNNTAAAATTRINLGLGWSALTNTNAAKTLLGFDTSGQVVANMGTNVLTFTNDVKFGGGELSIETQNISGGNVSFSFEDGLFGGPLVIASNSTITFLGNVAATTRTNLGLGWSALTNTNAATSLLGVTTNGQVVANIAEFNLEFTNSAVAFRTLAPNNIQFPTTSDAIIYYDGDEYLQFASNTVLAWRPIAFTNTSAATTRANLGFSTNLNTLWTATNTSNARSAVGLGATWLTNTNVTNFKTALDLGSFRSPDGYAALYWGDTEYLNVEDGVNVYYPIYWSGTNGDANAAQTRTNLGLGWSALTNTNAATTLLGYDTNGQVVANMGTNVLTFTNNVRITEQADSTSFTFWGMQGWGAAVSLEERLLRDGETSAFQWGALENTSLVPLNFGDPSSAATTRTNLGLGATWLTNTNVTNFRTAVGLGETNNVSFGSVNASYMAVGGFVDNPNTAFIVDDGGMDETHYANGTIQWYSQTDFISEINLFNQYFASLVPNSAWTFHNPVAFNNTTNAAATRTNLGLGATWLTNTSASNFREDIGLGSNNSVQFSNVFITNSIAGSSVNYLLSIGAPDTGFTGVGGPAGSVNFRAGGTALWQATSSGLEFTTGAKVRGALDFQYGAGALGVISFSGTDPATGRAISRTNLGLGGGITTNRTFVSYNGTNYTTNVVTISNGIITGWTQ